MKNDLRFVFFSNQQKIPLLRLCLKYFLRYNQVDDLKVTAIMNSIDTDNLPYRDKIQYIDAKVKFDGTGRHFTETIWKGLQNIDEKYVFLFLEDYFFIKETDFAGLDDIIDLMENDDIDCFSFEEHIDAYCDKIKFDYEGKGKDNLLIKKRDHRYLYSLQPTIWKKSALQEIMSNFNLTPHEIDETIIDLQNKNTFKCICNSLPSYFGFLDINITKHFIIAYCELVRHGVFPFPINGFQYGDEPQFVKFTKKLIVEEDLLNNPEFKNTLLNITINDVIN